MSGWPRNLAGQKLRMHAGFGPKGCFTCQHLEWIENYYGNSLDPPEGQYICAVTSKGGLRQFPFLRTRCDRWDLSNHCPNCDGKGELPTGWSEPDYEDCPCCQWTEEEKAVIDQKGRE